MNRYSKQRIQATLVDKGYKYFTGGKPYNLNIVGVRNSATGKNITTNINVLPIQESIGQRT